jgi:hypothetical protein
MLSEEDFNARAETIKKIVLAGSEVANYEQLNTECRKQYVGRTLLPGEAMPEGEALTAAFEQIVAGLVTSEVTNDHLYAHHKERVPDALAAIADQFRERKAQFAASGQPTSSKSI